MELYQIIKQYHPPMTPIKIPPNNKFHLSLNLNNQYPHNLFLYNNFNKSLNLIKLISQ